MHQVFSTAFRLLVPILLLSPFLTSSFSNAGTAVIDVRSQAPSVSPDGGDTDADEQSSGNTAAFSVDNPTSSGEWFDYACDYTGKVSSCDVAWDGYVPAQSNAQADVYFDTDNPGSGTVSLMVGGGGYDEGWYDVTVQEVLRVAPVVSGLIHAGENREVSRCIADCFDAVATYKTTPYIAGDVPRSVTLLYRSQQAAPLGLVQLDVTDNSLQPAAKLSLRLKKSDGSFVSFTNGSTELFFARGSGINRLAAQFDASALATGSYVYTAVVTSYWPDSTQRQKTLPIRVLISNEAGSRFGWGWTVAGLQRLHPQAGGGVVATDGTGSIAYFASACAGCQHASPPEDYTVLTNRAVVGVDSIKYDRAYGNGIVYSFYADGSLKQVSDQFGNKTVYTYNSLGQLVKIKAPDGFLLETRLAYGTDGKLDSIWHGGYANPAVTFVNIDANNNLSSIIDKEGGSPAGPYAAAFSYDAAHRMIRKYRRDSSYTSIAYDYAGRVAADSSPAIIVGGASVRPIVLYRSSATAALIDPSTSVGSYNNPRVAIGDTVSATITDPQGYATKYRLDRWEQPLQITDPLGNGTLIWRGGFGGARPAHITYPTGASEDLSYDNGRLVYRRGVNGDTLRIRYGPYDRPDSIWGTGLAQRIFVNSLGLADSARVDTFVVKYHYDTRGRLDTIIDPSGHKTSIWYHLHNGNKEIVRLPGGRFTQDSFDVAGRKIWTHQLGSARAWSSYDILGRATKTWTEGANPGDTVRTYYGRALVDSVKDANGNLFRVEANSLGWPVKAYDPDPAKGHAVHAYDKNGRVVSSTNRRGQTIYRSYDPIGRVTKKWGTSTTTDTFTYTNDGREAVAQNSVSKDEVYKSQTGWTDSVVATLNGKRFRIWYKPDAQGRLDSVQVNASGSSIVFAGRKYTYDPVKKALATMRINGSTVRLGFAGELNVDTIIYPGPTRFVSRTTNNEVWAESFGPTQVWINFWRNYGRDSVGRITSVARKFGSGYSSYQVRRFRYDGQGRLVGEKVQDTSTYCAVNADYGSAGSFCSVPIPLTRSHDAAGNLLVSGTDTGTYAIGNRITKWAGKTIIHDADGNVTAKGSTTYSWSSDGRLVSVSAGGVTFDFEYNAFGQPVRRKKNGSVDRYFLWDRGHLLAELDSSGTKRVSEYVYLPGVDRPLAIVTGATTVQKTRFVVQDQTGNIIGLFDSAGVVHQDVYYSVSGQRTTWGAVADTNRVQWKGLVFQEAPANLYYVRSRWYDPEIGRFLSEDRAGITAGLNVYTFASGDPINALDPSGLYSWRKFFGEFSNVLEDVLRFAPYVAVVTITLASGGTFTAFMGAMEAMGAAALGSAFASGLQHAATGDPFWRLFQQNFGMASLHFSLSSIAAMTNGGLVEAGAKMPFQGFVQSKNPLGGFWGGLTIGSGALYSGCSVDASSGLCADLAEAGVKLWEHELGHTFQFFLISRVVGDAGNAWVPYFGLGLLGLTPAGCSWEKMANVLGSGSYGVC